MTGIKLKVKKVIRRKCSTIRYFVNNLESLTDVEALIVEALYLGDFVCCDCEV
jgi:hypothetical protein